MREYNEEILASSAAPNKQLQRTVQTASRRTACASFHYAHAARWLGQRAAAELRRYALYHPACQLAGRTT